MKISVIRSNMNIIYFLGPFCVSLFETIAETRSSAKTASFVLLSRDSVAVLVGATADTHKTSLSFCLSGTTWEKCDSKFLEFLWLNVAHSGRSTDKRCALIPPDG